MFVDLGGLGRQVNQGAFDLERFAADIVHPVMRISLTPGRSILMTRVPISASWRVANGVAIACSMRDNGDAFKGLRRGLSEGSSEGHRGVHRQPAFMIAAPQANGFAIG